MSAQWRRKYGPTSEWTEGPEKAAGSDEPDNRTSGPSPERVPGGSETVLVVEDQPEVLDAIATILRRLGYGVMTARNLDEAVQAAGEIEDLPLLLTDVVLPGQNGLAVAEHVLRMRPGAKVIYMSAFTSDVVVPVADRFSGNFLAKPFTMEDIAAKIRSVLDGG